MLAFCWGTRTPKGGMSALSLLHPHEQTLARAVSTSVQCHCRHGATYTRRMLGAANLKRRIFLVCADYSIRSRVHVLTTSFPSSPLLIGADEIINILPLVSKVRTSSVPVRDWIHVAP
jgi:hypothetical protein